MPLFEGVGPRIAKRLIELRYVRTDGKPDVRRFCLEHGYDKTLFYYWLKDRSTPMKEQGRLAKDLRVTRRYLLLGDEEPAIRGASDSPYPQDDGTTSSIMTRRLLRLPNVLIRASSGCASSAQPLATPIAA
jgi:hypothetical protein